METPLPYNSSAFSYPAGDEDVYAGREIGDALRRGLRMLEVEFNKLSAEQKLQVAKALRDLPAAATAWDIQALLTNNLRGFGIAGGGWGTGKGLGTVTVDGKVYWAPAVNYILWGKINRLVYDSGVEKSNLSITSIMDAGLVRKFSPPLESHSFDWTIKTVTMYRPARNIIDGGGVDGPVAWAKVGWTGSWTFASNAVLTKPGYNYVPSPINYNGGLQWRVAPAGLMGDRSEIRSGEGQKGIIDFLARPNRLR